MGLTQKRVVVALGMTLVMLGNGAAAYAAPPKGAPKVSAAARSYEEAGRQLAAGNYEAALALYAKLPNIEARRGAALALDKLGRTEEAITEYQRFIAGAPAALEEQTKLARSRVAELSAAKVVKVRVVTTPAGAAIEVAGAGQPLPPRTSPTELELAPGHYVVRATLAGTNPATRELDVVASTPQEVSLDLLPFTAASVASSSPSSAAAATAGPAMSPTPHREPTNAPPGIERLGAPIATGAVAAIALGAGVFFGLSALSKKSDYDADPSEKRLAAGETAAAMSTISLTAGLVLGAATVVLFLTMPPADGPASSPKTGLLRDGFRLRF